MANKANENTVEGLRAKNKQLREERDKLNLSDKNYEQTVKKLNAEINKNEVFKPYKDLCAKISTNIIDYNPKYKYPRSLSSTLIETSHNQQFFSSFLPKLTDQKSGKHVDYVHLFIEDLLFKALA